MDQALLASVPMPATDRKLSDRLPSLQARADAGDSLAACRLGVELLRCAALGSYHPAHDDSMARDESELDAKGDQLAANKIAAARLLHAQLRVACAGVPTTLVDRASHYVRQAALAGEPEAMVRYAGGETLMAGKLSMAFVKTPEFDTWRREARPVLIRALNAGYPEAALLLAKAHGGNDAHLAMLLPRDAVEARASLALAHLLFGDDPALERGLFGNNPVQTLVDPRHFLGADQLAAAHRQAEDWHKRQFQGRSFALAESTAALLPLHRRIEFENGSPDWPGTPRPVPCDASPGVNP